jgi:dTDP-4-amino-4,6-dideoxygalactose transaminase
MATRFDGNFTQQEPISEEAIARAVAILRSGRLHRYNTLEGEVSEVALLELEFRELIGSAYCLAVTSGGYAMTTALRAAGLEAGEAVLTNAFTLSPVPGAIFAAGGRPVLVEITQDLVIDLTDLRAKALASQARFLLLSHMRGHIVNMDQLMSLCRSLQITVIEDCAHTMGAAWADVPTGRYGLVGCFSTQTYKHLNSGEGGLLVTDDAQVMARATLLSGSYMLYGRHPAGPPVETFENSRWQMPNSSGRLDNLRAAILRPQLPHLAGNAARWNERYQTVIAEIKGVKGIVLPERPVEEKFVASSVQFRLPALDAAAMQSFLQRCFVRGVELKWFGAPQPVGYTSTHHSWQYVAAQSLPNTDKILATLCDMRLPLTFSLADCRTIGQIIREAAGESVDAVPMIEARDAFFARDIA